jgi:c-di-GMP-binding flagellar brake protein YcgR
MAFNTDLRFYARFEYVECVMIYDSEETEPYRAMLVDIGLGGVQLRSKEPLPTDRLLTIQLGQDGQKPLEMKGNARYSSPDEEGMYITGFKFAPESHEERVTVAEYVHGVFQRQWRASA